MLVGPGSTGLFKRSGWWGPRTKSGAEAGALLKLSALVFAYQLSAFKHAIFLRYDSGGLFVHSDSDGQDS